MPRNFLTRFMRTIAGPFAGDAAPGAAQVVNNPATGAGTLFRMAPTRPDDMRRATNGWQGYYTATGAWAGTLTLQLWVNAALGTTPGDWVQVGTPLAGVPEARLFEANGYIEDADVFVQVTPSVATALGEDISLFLEEAEVR